MESVILKNERRRMKRHVWLLTLVSLLIVMFVPWSFTLKTGQATTVQSLTLSGLRAPVRVVRDSNYIPHIYAENDHDVIFMLGYLHAQDRFFQMDLRRRQVSGRLAELLGQGALSSDIQLRTLGLDRAARESFASYGRAMQAVFQAYSNGVNAWLNDTSQPLPPEYRILEISRQAIPAWTPIDSINVGKGLAFSLSNSISEEINLSLSLSAYQSAGDAAGFDGTLLFLEDVFRTAPFDPTVSLPGFMPKAKIQSSSKLNKMLIDSLRRLPQVMTPAVRQLAEEYLNEINSLPYVRELFDRQAADIGSNWWIISGRNTTTGHPMLASDPHLALDTPPIWYEAHLIVSNDPEFGPMNVNGVTLAGAPGVVLGCNDRICWGATVNPLDVTDVYLEELRNGPDGFPAFTVFEGREEPLTLIPQKYLVNRIGDGIADNLVRANVGPAEGGVTLVVPRRNNGPIVRVLFGALGLSVQYTGWRSTLEFDVFRQWARARNLDDFKRGLESFDFGSQNWAYADVDGNIAYFTTVEVPVREDLQAGMIDGVPPFLIRDGTHTARNEWLPVQNRQPGQSLNYEILPADELPNAVNPPQGYIANANQDPIGTSLDNNPLNQLRPNGGIYYLNVGYDGGFRQGRIVRLIEASLAGGNKISLRRMQRIQANDQMLDAEILTPYILAAFNNSADAPGELGALHNDQRIIDAVARLRRWDFSTPTGIREGYDPGDDPDNLPEPSREEIRNSVAATIYSVWRARIIANTIDAVLTDLGLQNNLPGSDQALAALRHLLDNFETRKGFGASGINFFRVPGAPTPEAARDTIILRSLREALDLLASSTFAAAFGRSTNQEDYRWGRLHRIIFDHPLRGPFDIPPAGGFSNVSSQLLGVARNGGFQVVNASGHGARASSVNAFMFGSGASRRIVADMDPDGVVAFQIIPGGQSGVLGSPFYANQLGRWLTHQYHPLLLSPGQVRRDTVSELVYTP